MHRRISLFAPSSSGISALALKLVLPPAFMRSQTGQRVNINTPAGYWLFPILLRLRVQTSTAWWFRSDEPTLPQCHNARMPQGHDATMPQCQCQNAKMPPCQNATIPQCHDATTPRCHNAATPQRHNAIMPRCRNVKFRELCGRGYIFQ